MHVGLGEERIREESRLGYWRHETLTSYLDRWATQRPDRTAFVDAQYTADSHTPDGWFKTGDRARLDRDGYLAITGRSKDLIIRGGENIPVAEVENLLFAHPKVQSIAIVARPDPRLAERACAFVIPALGQTPTLGELTGYLDARGIARHKFPERLVLVDELPMTPSGKVQKYRLRQQIADTLARENTGQP